MVQKMIGMAEFTDISGIFASSAQMIAECKGTVYGYLRVSTAAQKHDRQMDAMKELGVMKEHMFFDKQSGKDFNRPGYQKLLEHLKENDLLVIKNIDRLGRNTKEVKEQWRIITQEKHVSIVVIDTPILNAGKELGPLGQALSDIIFAIFSMVADFDRQSIYQRLQEGLHVAMRERGVKPGRKAKAVPEGFHKIKEAYEKGEISQRSAAKQLGVDRKTFCKWIAEAKIVGEETEEYMQTEELLEQNTPKENIPKEKLTEEGTYNEYCSKARVMEEDTFREKMQEDISKQNDIDIFERTNYYEKNDKKKVAEKSAVKKINSKDIKMGTKKVDDDKCANTSKTDEEDTLLSKVY